ncbi:MAG TPA: hypothetical protein VK850_10675 [Candidatus Binatia bacterium]|nr:hypothetical protein [Candidatus Binatia bacterium]
MEKNTEVPREPSRRPKGVFSGDWESFNVNVTSKWLFLEGFHCFWEEKPPTSCQACRRTEGKALRRRLLAGAHEESNAGALFGAHHAVMAFAATAAALGVWAELMTGEPKHEAGGHKHYEIVEGVGDHHGFSCRSIRSFNPFRPMGTTSDCPLRSQTRANRLRSSS